jgi:hypothetical protein
MHADCDLPLQECDTFWWEGVWSRDNAKNDIGYLKENCVAVFRMCCASHELEGDTNLFYSYHKMTHSTAVNLQE